MPVAESTVNRLNEKNIENKIINKLKSKKNGRNSNKK